MIELFYNFLDLFLESAPWLLLGLLLAGVMKWLIPENLLKKHMGGANLSAVIKASLIGVPLPLCSCGVIPAAVGLRRSGASKPATVSFLIATPETGVDSISVSYALLGPFIAIIRPISAILTAIYTALLVKIFSSENSNNNADLEGDAKLKNDENIANVEEKAEKTCCGKRTQAEPVQLSWQQKLKQTLQFSSGKLLNDISLWLLIGLAVAAMIKTWVPSEFLTQWGSGFLAMLVMALVGVPMYICATASTPMAAGFLAAGISPGAVLVFMLAGPATNLSTMGMVRQELGVRILICYVLGILSASIGLGYLVNFLIAQFDFKVAYVASAAHEMEHSFVYLLSGAILALLMLKNVVVKLMKTSLKS